MADSLPARPSWEFLQKQAKTWLRNARAGDPTTLAQWRDLRAAESAARWIRPRTGEPEPFCLADAQRWIAHQYGFRSWVELKQHVADLQLSAAQQAAQIEALLQWCLDGQLDRVNRFLARHEHLLEQDIHLAAACGHPARVAAMLDQDPARVHHPAGPLHAPPLVYACASRFAAPQHPRAQGIDQVVEILLSRGAEPNVVWYASTSSTHAPLTPLYAACGRNGNPDLTRRLLEAGADPNDNESLYHATEHADPTCVRLLLAAGARSSNTNALHHAIGQGNLAAIRVLLEQGADPQEPLGGQPSMTPFLWAISCDQRAEILETLLEFGADPTARCRDGRSAYRLAAVRGHRGALELLAARGLRESLSTDEQLLAACMLGDTVQARELLARASSPERLVSAAACHVLYEAAWQGNLAAVQTLVELGISVDATNHRQASALHAAAWKAHEAIVDFLLARQPRLDQRDADFQCTPLEWALHGSVNYRPLATADPRAADGPSPLDLRFAAVVARFLEAGSPPPVARLLQPTAGPVRLVLQQAGLLEDDNEDDPVPPR